jgi:hypothetical protein
MFTPSTAEGKRESAKMSESAKRHFARKREDERKREKNYEAV